MRPQIDAILQLRGNRLLGSLRNTDIDMIAPHLARLRFNPGQTIRTIDAPIDAILFPETIIVCLSATRNPASVRPIGIVGREGLLGWPLLLGCDVAPHGETVQLSGGTALAIDATAMRAAFDRSPTLRAIILRFVQTMTEQLTGTIASLQRDGLEQRLARWLLMLHDREEGDELTMTHDLLATHLGTRRAGITDCLHVLEGDHVVRCARGRVIVRDRRALEVVAGAAYGAPEARYRSLIGPFGG